MFKRALMFAIFFILAAILLLKGTALPLRFFIFFPMLFFPVYYFVETKDRVAVVGSLIFALLLFLYYFVRMPSLGMALFGFGHIVFMGALAAYWSFWQRTVQVECDRSEVVTRELELLKQKHQSRLESLHHLEKQVAGLLDLFEIAREFSDGLSFDRMAEILQKKVLPEMHFDKMYFFIFPKEKDGEVQPAGQSFAITAQGIQTAVEDMPPDEAELIEVIKKGHQFIQQDRKWVFPLMADGQLAACLLIDGASTDDLAKFEVLCAYLALQVKKVQLYETVKELSIRDSLTGLFVRRHFVERFEEELKRCLKYSLPMAVLMLDIDHFKRYNDEHGHLAGDGALKQVAALLRQNLRKVDILARYGGEEFVIVAPETRKEGAFEVAERIRSSIARHGFKIYNVETRVTVSIGVALYPTDVPEDKRVVYQPSLAHELIQCADKALYRAKDEGRNRIVFYSDL